MATAGSQCIVISDSILSNVRGIGEEARGCATQLIPTICDVNLHNVAHPWQRVCRFDENPLPLTAIDQRTMFFYMFSYNTLIMLGINDCMELGMDGLGKFYDQYTTLARFIKLFNHEYDVLISPIHRLNESGPDAACCTAYRNVVQQVANENGMHFISGLDLIPANQTYYDDNLHMNMAGHALFATNLKNAMQALNLWAADYA